MCMMDRYPASLIPRSCMNVPQLFCWFIPNTCHLLTINNFCRKILLYRRFGNFTSEITSMYYSNDTYCHTSGLILWWPTYILCNILSVCSHVPRLSPSSLYVCAILLPRAHAQGVKQSSVVVVVVGTKIARSRVLGVYACCKHNQSIDIGEKLVCTGFEFLKKAY